MTDVTPFLWFDDDGEAAILFYTALIPGSEVVSIASTSATCGRRRRRRGWAPLCAVPEGRRCVRTRVRTLMLLPTYTT